MIKQFSGENDSQKNLNNQLKTMKSCFSSQDHEKSIISIRHYLHKKYFEVFNFYFAKPINEILAGVKNSMVILFRDLAYYDSDKEYMRRFYTKEESVVRLQNYTNYYQEIQKKFYSKLPLVEQAPILQKNMIKQHRLRFKKHTESQEDPNLMQQNQVPHENILDIEQSEEDDENQISVVNEIHPKLDFLNEIEKNTDKISFETEEHDIYNPTYSSRSEIVDISKSEILDVEDFNRKFSIETNNAHLQNILKLNDSEESYQSDINTFNNLINNDENQNMLSNIQTNSKNSTKKKIDNPKIMKNYSQKLNVFGDLTDKLIEKIENNINRGNDHTQRLNSSSKRTILTTATTSRVSSGCKIPPLSQNNNTTTGKNQGGNSQKHVAPSLDIKKNLPKNSKNDANLKYVSHLKNNNFFISPVSNAERSTEIKKSLSGSDSNFYPKNENQSNIILTVKPPNTNFQENINQRAKSTHNPYEIIKNIHFNHDLKSQILNTKINGIIKSTGLTSQHTNTINRYGTMCDYAQNGNENKKIYPLSNDPSTKHKANTLGSQTINSGNFNYPTLKFLMEKYHSKNINSQKKHQESAIPTSPVSTSQIKSYVSCSINPNSLTSRSSAQNCLSKISAQTSPVVALNPKYVSLKDKKTNILGHNTKSTADLHAKIQPSVVLKNNSKPEKITRMKTDRSTPNLCQKGGSLHNYKSMSNSKAKPGTITLQHQNTGNIKHGISSKIYNKTSLTENDNKRIHLKSGNNTTLSRSESRPSFECTNHQPKVLNNKFINPAENSDLQHRVGLKLNFQKLSSKEEEFYEDGSYGFWTSRSSKEAGSGNNNHNAVGIKDEKMGKNNQCEDAIINNLLTKIKTTSKLYKISNPKENTGSTWSANFKIKSDKKNSSCKPGDKIINVASSLPSEYLSLNQYLNYINHHNSDHPAHEQMLLNLKEQRTRLQN